MSKATLYRRELCFHRLHGKKPFIQNLVVVQDVQKFSRFKKKSER
jgi:hypothetical protein